MIRTTCLLALAAWLVAFPAQASDNLLMARSQDEFPEAMLALQGAIRSHGYDVSRVQRVDIGLNARGFESDKYRVVFFGKLAETRHWTTRHPELIDYLPLNVTIYAEERQTVLVAVNPVLLSAHLPDPELSVQLQRWESDLRSILHEVQKRSVR